LSVTANVTSSPIPVTKITEAILSSETPVLIIATRRNIPDDIFSQLKNVLQIFLGKDVETTEPSITLGSKQTESRMVSYWMLGRVALVRTDVSEERSAFLHQGDKIR
jgi:hypothetical protein